MDQSTLFDDFKALNFPAGEYVLFGSAPMCVRGLKDCKHDLDVLVTEKLWNDCIKNGWELRKALNTGSHFLYKNGIELWREWKPGDWDVKQLIVEAESIDGMYFVKLETVLQWKKIANREKDQDHIKIIEKFLQTQK